MSEATRPPMSLASDPGGARPEGPPVEGRSGACVSVERSYSFDVDATDTMGRLSIVMTAPHVQSYGMVQRCVIVQKDEFGFGLTVSGDNPVFVQSVRKDGAAMRAGVQQGDRIIKVNGTLVTQSNHLEVVKLIKSGSYVALTLLGRPPGCPEPPPSLADARHDSLLSLVGSPGLSPDHNSSLLAGSRDSSSSSPGTNDEHRGVLRDGRPGLQRLLEQAKEERERLLEDPRSAEVPHLINEIRSIEARIQQLEQRLRRAGDGTQDFVDGFQENKSGAKLVRQHGEENAAGQPDLLSSLPENFMGKKLQDLEENSSLASGKGAARRAMSHDIHSTHSDIPVNHMIPPCSAPPTTIFPQHSIIGPEDEDFPSDSEQADNQAVFARLERVKERPAHMAVFLQYVVSQHDPAPLMLNLMADAVLHSKEPRKMFASFYMLFLDRHAPLKVTLADSIQSEFDEAKNREDVPEATLGEARESVLRVIEEQLQDYRSKSEMGLGSFYGENELMSLSGDQMEERMAAEQLCAKLMDIIGKMEEDRRNAMVTVITTYMQGVGVKMKWARPVPSLERPPSSTDKRLFNILPNKKKPVPKKEKDLMKENDKKRFSLFQDKWKRDRDKGSQFYFPAMPVPNPSDGRSSSLPKLPRLAGPSLDVYDLSTESSSPGMGAYPSITPSNSSSPRLLPRYPTVDESDLENGGVNPSMGRRSSEQLGATDGRTPKHRVSLEPPVEPSPIPMGDEDGGDSDSITSQTVSESENVSRQSMVSVPSEDDQSREPEELETPNWQHSVDPEVLKDLPVIEVKRQEVINELFHTEKKHVQNLKVLYEVFFSRLAPVLTNNETYQIFINLDEILPIHESLNEAMRKIREKSQVVAEIGDLMLARFDGEAGEVLKAATAKFCSLQSQALDIVRSKQKKDPRFQQLMMEAESKPKCRRLQLKDFMLTEMQRLTKYPLLLQNILKYTQVEHPDHKKLHKAGECCRRILNDVNETVRETENAQRLEDYQRRLDLSSLERSYNPLVTDFKNLDLTHKKMLYEGPLTWRVNKEKSIDLHVLLLEDLLVLLQKQDERLVLRCYSKTSAGTATDAKQTFSPVIKLGTVLVRPVATDKRAFFLITTSQLGPQIYELVAVTSKEMLIWQTQLEHAVEKEKQQEGTQNMTSFILLGPQGYKKPRASTSHEHKDSVATVVGKQGGDDVRPSSFTSLSDDILDVTAGKEESGDVAASGSLDAYSEPEEAQLMTRVPETMSRRSVAVELEEEPGAEKELAQAALRDVGLLRRMLVRHLRVVAGPRDDGDLERGLSLLQSQLSYSPHPTRSPHHSARGEEAVDGRRGEADEKEEEEEDAPAGGVSGTHDDWKGAGRGAGDAVHFSDEAQRLEQNGTGSAEGGTVPVIRREGNYFFLARPTGPQESSTDDDVAGGGGVEKHERLAESDEEGGGEAASASALYRSEEVSERLQTFPSSSSGSDHFSRYHDHTAVPVSLYQDELEPPSPRVVFSPLPVDDVFNTLESLTQKLKLLQAIEEKFNMNE
ncbi:rho guanine nucleotide exchange factor 12-like isoform X2 [Petromyzon marinus]|uniref:Rho guanine nucleotide exchange factor 11-like isoform X2 n=1 Tax=Petromyzon marinus TaxID=7757 RepID=A0AAJ7X3W8_PETMA|nr:rho guanine nucleotide exchange factor 11-like isoform X2 [Petromyzon marinus]